MRGVQSAPLIGLLAIVSLAACAQGGSSDAEVEDSASPDTKPSVLDSEVPDGADVADIITADDTGAGEGSIFDALDDAPCTSGTTLTCTTSCKTPGDATC